MKSCFEDQYVEEGDGDIICIVAPKVTRELVDHIFENYYPEMIYFDECVEEFGDHAFESRNLCCVALDSAKNVRILGNSCFESAYNIDSNQAFESVELIGKACFKDSIVVGRIELPKVKVIPEYAFWNADAYKISAPIASKESDTSFKYAAAEGGIVYKEILDVMNNAMIL